MQLQRVMIVGRGRGRKVVGVRYTMTSIMKVGVKNGGIATLPHCE